MLTVQLLRTCCGAHRSDGGDVHILEIMQAVAERRQGGVSRTIIAVESGQPRLVQTGFPAAILTSFQQSSCGQETGVRWVEALRGERAWAAHTAGSWEAGGWSAELFEACLCRSQTLAQVRRVSHSHTLVTALF